MKDKDYFVILNTQNGNVPLLDADGNMEFFERPEKARNAAKTSYFGSEYGFEVFELGMGEFNG